jgi:hypothetical protein
MPRYILPLALRGRWEGHNLTSVELGPLGPAEHLDAIVRANINIFVPTTIHIPDPLLERVDTRAKTLGISRNRLILEALEEKVGARDEWAPELVHMLAEPVSSTAGKELEDSIAVVRSRRSSRKGPPKL